MNNISFRSRPSSLVSVVSGSRAALSPLLRRATQTALARRGAAARLAGTRVSPATVPASETLSPATPGTPTPFERWWNPHLLDRLQTPLSRIRE